MSCFTRLKREEWKRTRHDSVFSKWEILIGASDWENHKLGKENTQKYRLHNIPSIASRPGLYELGVAAVCTDLGRQIRKLDPDHIVVVYLGQADNVRNRLQHYGRAGSHLGESCGPGLFKEVFDRGFPIVFRWVGMESKKVAEKTEVELLGVFDYAWNKGGNGVRRPDDVFVKLDAIISRNVSKFQKWLENYLLRQKKQGIKIRARAHSTPKLVTVEREFSKADAIVCGLFLSDGTVCSRTPLKGRKRCEEHKGKKNMKHSSRWITEEKLVVSDVTVKDEFVYVETSPQRGVKSESCEGNGVSISEKSNIKLLPEEVGTVCGIVLEDQSICRNSAIVGRKRCSQHKGMRINESLRKSATEGNMHICGVDLGYGNACMEIPAHGRKRCESHKGRRATASSY